MILLKYITHQVQLILVLKYLGLNLLLITSFNSYSASFDCKKAKTNIENMICSSAEIGKLDLMLADEYRSAFSKDKSNKERQLNWLRERNKCTNENCLKNLYKERVSELEEFNVQYDRNFLNQEQDVPAQATKDKKETKLSTTQWLSLSRDKSNLFCASFLLRTSGLIKNENEGFSMLSRHLQTNGQILLNRSLLSNKINSDDSTEAVNTGLAHANYWVNLDMLSVIKKGTDLNRTIMNCLERVK